MRNIFDQYEQPENRLTHALSCCLAEDGSLLRSFVTWVCGSAKRGSTPLHIIEQQIPAGQPGKVGGSERTGLPDAWIHDDGCWSLLIESKIASPFNLDQIRRHRLTAQRQGFTDVTVLVLLPKLPTRASPASTVFRRWIDLYAWLSLKKGRSHWARRLREYMEVAEAGLMERGYDLRGGLTLFDGIHFHPSRAYSYREAKRFLCLAMDELQQDKRLTALGVGAKAPRRPAITGRNVDRVWDILRFRRHAAERDFTKHPHLTLSIGHDRVLVMLSLPHKLQMVFRRKLVRVGLDGFKAAVLRVEHGMRRVLKNSPEAKPWMHIAQRHYRSQRGRPVSDAILEFDLRTAMAGASGSGKAGALVRFQPHWLETAYDVFAEKRSNLHVGIGVNFPIHCSAIQSRKALDTFARSWVACGPILDILYG